MSNPNIKNYGFGSPGRTKEFDDAARAKTRGVPKPRRWTKERCVEQLEDLMDLLNKKIKGDDLKDLQIVIDKMMDIIRYLYPPTAKSVNLNIDVTANAVLERLKNWKEEQIVVVGTPQNGDEKDGI